MRKRCGYLRYVQSKHNDPNYGIATEYVDPSNFVHSFTDDPSFKDLSYAGHIKKITIQELKRLAGDDLTEEDFAMTPSLCLANGNNSVNLHKRRYDEMSKRNTYDYDEYLVEVLDFEYKSVEAFTSRKRRIDLATADSISRALSTEKSQQCI